MNHTRQIRPRRVEPLAARQVRLTRPRRARLGLATGPTLRYTRRIDVPLSPLEFMRRARRLYGSREAVVDGDVRYTYEQFFARCERWAAHLQASGVRPGDRVVYIAPNTHAHLEAYYAVPMIGAVLVPVNYRLIADDFRYVINHSGASVVCAHGTYLEAVDSIRTDLPQVRQFVALDGARDGWQDYEAAVAAAGPPASLPRIQETGPPDHQLHQRHDFAPQGRDDHAPERVDERRRNARSPAHDIGGPLPVDAAHVPRQWLDVRLDGHGCRRHACVPPQGRATGGVRAGEARADHDAVRSADGAHRPRECCRRISGATCLQACAC